VEVKAEAGSIHQEEQAAAAGSEAAVGPEVEVKVAVAD